MDNKPVYIMSLEASDIYYHHEREMKLKRDYLGMIPFSLELIKLKEIGLKTKHIERRDKYISNDVINVKFNSKVKSADDMVEIYKRRLEYAKTDESAQSIQEYIELLEYHSTKSDYDDELWDEIGIDDLREKLYTDGFEIGFTQGNGNIKYEKYVVYKRSSAKSRTGQCLFIKKKLHSKMMKWSRMGMNLRKGQVIDLASLLAYESLVGSSLEGTINIDVNKILIVDDVDSKFMEVCNVVRKDESTGYLNSFEEEVEVSNSLFDGESLLDSKYFTDGQSMILLRNHMFKSASFNTNLQEFLKDNCPEGINYEDWQIPNMYGELMYAKDIDMIITPSSLKALKFSHTMPNGTELEMWNHWKKVVIDDDNLFGVCKHEKSSKLGFDEDGNVLQQTSYQMINCLPASREDIDELTKTEKEYITRLKKDNDFLVSEIYKHKDLTNSNEVISEMFNINKEIAKTKLFRDFKHTFIKTKVNHAKKGKIKIKGDYCVLLGNPSEFLFHSIGKWDGQTELVFSKNEVYTSLYKDKEEMIGFRNPNTSPSNVLIMKNKESDFINKYFNLNKNIVVVNAIDFPIQDILSGCDYDSDTMLVSGEKALVDIGKKCFGYYKPCVNHIEGKKKKYKLTNKDHFEIDKQLSHSQFNIGRVVNLGQISMSVYWDLINNFETGEHVDDLMKKVDVMTVLSGIAIDMAKKFYDIDMDKEIDYVASNKLLKDKKKKPKFWVNVSQNKNTRDNIEFYDCPMDYLDESLCKIPKLKSSPTVHLSKFISKQSKNNKVNSKQIEKLKNLITGYNTELSYLALNGKDSYDNISDVSNEYLYTIKKLKLNEESVRYLINELYDTDSELLLKTFKIIYDYQITLFKNIFKNS